MSQTPKEMRHELHRIISGALAGNGVEAADIYRYRTARFRDEAATHVVVTTHKLGADPLNQGDQLPYYFFRVMFFARYNDAASEEAAEDAIDNLEILAIASLAPAQENDLWESLDFLDGPERTSLQIVSKTYRFAQQIIKVEIN